MGGLSVPKNKGGTTESHRYAREQEKAAADLIGGRVTPGSGNGYQKGDARRRKLVRVECKCTSHISFRVTREMMDKLQEGVFGSGEVPVLQVDMLDVDGDRHDRFYVISEWAMEDLLERLTGEQPT